MFCEKCALGDEESAWGEMERCVNHSTPNIPVACIKVHHLHDVDSPISLKSQPWPEPEIPGLEKRRNGCMI